MYRVEFFITVTTQWPFSVIQSSNPLEPCFHEITISIRHQNDHFFLAPNAKQLINCSLMESHLCAASTWTCDMCTVKDSSQIYIFLSKYKIHINSKCCFSALVSSEKVHHFGIEQYFFKMFASELLSTLPSIRKSQIE